MRAAKHAPGSGCHAAILVALAGLAIGGCSRSQPLDMWRSALETYVRDRGSGDPAVLHDLPAQRSPRARRPARIVFGALDLPAPRGALSRVRDLRGVLVGVIEVESRWWYVFLVGSIDVKRTQAREVVGLRAVAFASTDGNLEWRDGDRDHDALEQYLAAREGGAQPLVGFPAPTDAFTLAVGAGIATVRDRASDAAWTVALVDDTAPGENDPTAVTSNGVIVADSEPGIIEMSSVETEVAESEPVEPEAMERIEAK